MNKIYGRIDEAAKNQFKICLKEEFVIDGALMPDAHYGYVAPIGSVIITRNKIVPAWVGYDIGCGVIAVKLKGAKLLDIVRKEARLIHTNVEKFVPMGLGKLNPEQKISKETKEKLAKLLKKLQKEAHNEDILNYLQRKALSNLGSLGHGNHFIEIDYTSKEVWLVIHSGSRHMGHEVASHYMEAAMDVHNAKGNVEQTFELDIKSNLGKEYLAIQEFLLEFALLNRIEISKEVIQALEKALDEKITSELWTNKNHNHAERIGKTQKFIHRKGATPSAKGERGVIPGNMRDGAFLVTGKGNKNFLESSSHGAGRAMSKTQARKQFTMKQFQNSMKGIRAVVKEETLDEAPFAYKDIFKVLKEQKDSIKIIKHLKPILNWKGESSRIY
jgi:tRNA-splicing ligase RtcB